MNRAFALVVILFGLAADAAAQSNTLCAVVKLEIAQEATLEREAFDAHLKVDNNLPDMPLTAFKVQVFFKDVNGNPAGDHFFVKVGTLTGVNAVDGTGVIQSSSSADIHWLIIPSSGTGGGLPAGERYAVSAVITGLSDSVPQTVNTFDAFITVHPQPVLKLEYVLPYEVFGDEPLTQGIEPIEPFPLGVRVTNVGHGTAKNFQIDSAQPKIVENKQGLLIDFKLLGTVVSGKTVPNTLLIPFGDVAANGVAQASWIMSTTLSGRFIEFTSTFTHAAELGGQLTSLLESVTTYTLVKDVLVDLPGRDAVPDFLVNRTMDRGQMQNVLNAGGVVPGETLLESDQPLALQVVDLPGTISGTLSGTNASLTFGFAAAVSSNVWVRASLPLSGIMGGLKLTSARRSDGKVLSLSNVWISKHFNKDGNVVSYRLNVFDLTSAAQTYTLQFDPTSLEAAPGAVTDLAAATSENGGALSLTWTAPGEDQYTGGILGGRYLIQASENAEGPFNPESSQVNIATSTFPGNLERLSAAGLVGNTTHYLRLWTQDTGGNMSALSNAATAYVRPYPLRDLVFDLVGSTTAAVSWQGGNNRLPIEYSVAASSAGGVVSSSSPWQDSFTRSYVFAGLTPNTTYFYAGQARNPETGAVSEVSALGAALTRAAVPLPLPVEVAVGSATVRWDTAGNPPSTEYLVELTSVAVEASYGWAAVSSHTFGGLAPATTYYARVKARNSALIETVYADLGSFMTPAVFNAPADLKPPRTELLVSSPQYTVGGLYITPATELALSATDDFSVAYDSAGAGGIVTYLAIDGDTFTVVSGTFTVGGGTHTLSFYSRDAAGNAEAPRTSSVTVDGRAPVASLSAQATSYLDVLSGTTYYADAGYLVLAGTDPDPASGVAALEYRVDRTTQPYAVYSGTFSLAQGLRVLEYRATDNLGNVGLALETTLYLDGAAPATELSVVGFSTHDANGDLVISTSAKVSLAALDLPADAASGVREVGCAVDGTTFAYSAPFGLALGAHTISYAAADNLGHEETLHTATVTVRSDSEDVLAPRTQLVVSTPSYLAGGLFVSTRTELSLLATDDFAVAYDSAGAEGLQTYLAVDGTGYAVVSGTFTLAGGTHTLSYFSRDAAGNTESSSTVSVAVDGLAPASQIAAGGSGGFDGLGRLWLSTSSLVALSATDLPEGSASGVQRIDYFVDGATAPVTYAAPFALAAGSHTVAYEAYDNLGSRETRRTTVVNVDLRNPVTLFNAGLPRFGFNPTYATPATPLTLTAFDHFIVQGDSAGVVAATYLAIDSSSTFSVQVGSFSVAAPGTHTVFWFSKDLAGNAEPLHSTVVIIDTQAPTTSLAVQGLAQLESRAQLHVSTSSILTLSAIDAPAGAASGVARTRMIIDNTFAACPVVVSTSAPAGSCANPVYGGPFSLAAGTHTVRYQTGDNVNNAETPRLAFFRVTNDTEVLPPIAVQPAVASIAPASATNEASANATVSGSGFAAGAGLLLERGLGGPGAWNASGAESARRTFYASARLGDGRVLVAGGIVGAADVATAEVYDPASNAWSPLPPMPGARQSGAAALLPDGRVLVFAGQDGSTYQFDSYFYNPATNAWTFAAPMQVARGGPAVAVLPDGRILAAGGAGTAGSLIHAELYDPANDTWTTVSSMTAARQGATASVLPDGRVIVIGGMNSGGDLSSTEIFDPATGGWTAGPALSQSRFAHTATALRDGRILVAGGTGSSVHPEAEVYASGSFAAVPSLSAARAYHAAALLPDGRVLVAGGDNGGSLSSTEVFDPATSAWSAGPAMSAGRAFFNLVPLFDGSVLAPDPDGQVYAPSRETVVGSTSSVTASSIAALLPLSGRTTGYWDVVAANPDGKRGTLAAGFQVLPPTTPPDAAAPVLSNAQVQSDQGVWSDPATTLVSLSTGGARLSAYDAGTGFVLGGSYAAQANTAGWWPLEGGAAADVSGAGHNGTVSGATATSGQVAGALQFDGSSQYVDLGTPNVLDGATAFTIEAWVHPDAGYTSDHRDVIQAATTNSATGNRWWLQTQVGSGAPTCGVHLNSASATITSSAGGLPAGVWTHVACTYDQSSAAFFMYVNGARVSAPVSGSYSGAVSDAGERLQMGRHFTGVHYFKGALDEVRVLRRSLSAAEISADAAASPASARFSADAGANWTSVPVATELAPGATAPYGPYLLSATNLPLARFTPDGTNLAAFTIADAAGNVATSTVAIRVAGASLASISVAPSSYELVAGATVQFSATGFYTDGSTRAVTDAAWSVSAATVASVDSTGLASALAAGAARILASSGTVSGSALLTVTPAPDVSAPLLSDAQVQSDQGVWSDPATTIVSLSTGGARVAAYDAGTGFVLGGSYAAQGSTAGWWPLGGNASDVSGGGHPGTVVGATSVEGQVGGALHFDGSSQYVDVGTPGILDGATAFTVEAWIKPDAGYTSDHGDVIQAATTNSSSGNRWWLQTSINSGVPVCGVHLNSASANLIGTSGVPVGVWTHLACTYDQSSSAYFMYVNGARVNATLSGSYSGAVADAGERLQIGRHFTSVHYFKGALDEVRVLRRALSPAEVAADAAASPASARFSADAGATWTSVPVATELAPGATAPYGPYLLSATDLPLAQLTPDGTNLAAFTIADAAGNVATSTVAIRVAAPSGPWFKPGTTTVTARTSSSLSLSWLPNGNGPAATYSVAIGTSPSDGSCISGDVFQRYDFVGSTTSHVAEGLLPGTTYVVTICNTRITSDGCNTNVVAYTRTDAGTELNPSFRSCEGGGETGGGGGAFPQGGLAVRADAAGRVWIVAAKDGLVRAGRYSTSGVLEAAADLPDAVSDDGSWSLHFDASGNAYAVGTASAGAKIDLAVYKLSPEVQVLSTQRFADAAGSKAFSFDSSGDLWITGGLQEGSFQDGSARLTMGLWKYDLAAGLLSLTTTYTRGGAIQAGFGVRTFGGDVYVLAYTSTASLSSPVLDVELLRFDGAGHGPLASSVKPGYLSQIENEVSAKLEVSGGSLWAAAQKTVSGGVNDLVLARYDAAGSVLLERRLSANGASLAPEGAAVDPQGRLVLALVAVDQGNKHVGVARYDADGALVDVRGDSRLDGGVRGAAMLGSDLWLAVGASTAPWLFNGDTPLDATDIFVSSAAPPAAPPIVVAPSTGPVGVTVTISSSGFGAYAGSGTRVRFGAGGPLAALSVWNDTTIVGTVPGLSTGTYELRVEIDGPSSTTVRSAGAFQVLLPAPSAVSPSSFTVGAPFTVSGDHFGAYAGTLTRALIGGATAALSVWDDRTVAGTVPGSLAPGVYPLVIERQAPDGYVADSSSLTVAVVGPRADSVDPSTGPIGVPLTVRGSGFGPYAGAATRLRFGAGGPTVPLSVWDDATIAGTVPSLSTGAYELLVEREEGGSVSSVAVGSFTVLAPHVSTATPASGPVGTAFTLSGEHFGPYAGALTRVLVGGATAALSIWNDETISATVPGGVSGGTQPVVVERATADGGLMDAEPVLVFVVVSPAAGSLTPSTGPIGAPFTLSGSGFGEYAGTNTRVRFGAGGPTAPLSVWNETTIAGEVPGLSTGAYAVLVERQEGSSVETTAVATFTVLLPEIASISPASGPIGAAVTVTGAHFGPYAGTRTRLMIGGAAAALSVWNDGTIAGTVPGSLSGGPQDVVVERESADGAVMRSTAAVYTVVAPQGSIDPSTGPIGIPFTISGSGFGLYAGTSTRVRFGAGGPTAPLSVWSDTTISGTIPGLSAGAYAVLVERQEGASTQSTAIGTFTVQVPEIASYSPSSAPIGAPFTIAGSGFGPYAGTLTRVKIGGVVAPLSVWNDQTIVGSVPGELAPGATTLIVERASSDGGLMTAQALAFEVLVPTISTMTPGHGQPGDAFALEGFGFGPYGGSQTQVLFDGSIAAPLSVWTNELIRGVVPDGLDVGTHTVVVRRSPSGGSVDSEAWVFTIGGMGGGALSLAEAAAHPAWWYEATLPLPASEGGKVTAPSRASVSVPARALAADAVLTIRRPATNGPQASLRAAQAVSGTLGRGGEPVEFGPEGSHFAAPVVIELPYDPAAVALGKLGDLAIHYWDPQAKSWQRLETELDVLHHRARARTDHFSLYQPLVSGVTPTAAAAEFGIRQVYAFPNPARQNGATIRVQAGAADWVEIKVFDVSGEQKAEGRVSSWSMVDDGTGARPTFDWRWDASGAGSGVYVYTVKAHKDGSGDQRRTGRLAVIK